MYKMKKKIYTIIILLLCTYTINAQISKTPNGFEIRSGVNLGLWLSQSDKRGLERENFIKEADFDSIAKFGFDHIRLPIDEVQFWDENGNKIEDAFKLMHKAIDWSIDRNLRVIVDLHIIRSHYFNSKSNTLWKDPKEQKKLANIWLQLSNDLKQYSNEYVAYELMNEAVAKKHDDWNNLIGMLITEVRKSEPNRTIIVGSNKWQKAETFKYLKVPENDKNIILSYHYYTPFGLTHYEASWMALKDYHGRVNYPGITFPKKDLKKHPVKEQMEIGWATGDYNKSKLLKEMQPAIDKAKELGLPLFCGEFGVIANAPQEPALRWYKDMIEIFKENNISFCHWVYRGDFPLLDKKGLPMYKTIDVLVN